MTATDEHARGGSEAEGKDPSADQLADWVAKVASDGDTAAFEGLFVHFAPRLERYMMRLGASQETADELVQETLCTLWRRAGSYKRDTAAVSTWVFTIARNLRIDRLRRMRYVEIPLPPDHAEQHASEDDHQTLLDGGRLFELIQDLPDEQRQVLELVYIEGLSHSEISERLTLPLGTVKSRLRRALARLRDLGGE